MTLLWIRKKIHWSDTDAAGIAWFPNFFGWFEDAEEELYTAVLGRSRQSLLDADRFGMPRVAAHAEYRAPRPLAANPADRARRIGSLRLTLVSYKFKVQSSKPVMFIDLLLTTPRRLEAPSR